MCSVSFIFQFPLNQTNSIFKNTMFEVIKAHVSDLDGTLLFLDTIFFSAFCSLTLFLILLY